MTDFSSSAPIQPEKPHELHEQELMPKPPGSGPREVGSRLLLLILGIAFALGATVMGIEIIGGWDARRNPIVPGMATIGALGGISLAYLIVRNRWYPAMIGLGILLAAGSMMFFGYLRDAYADDPGFMGTFFTVSAAILFVVGMLYLAGAWLWIEMKDRNRPPEPAGT